jgi:hypothetical protein
LQTQVKGPSRSAAGWEKGFKNEREERAKTTIETVGLGRLGMPVANAFCKRNRYFYLRLPAGEIAPPSGITSEATHSAISSEYNIRAEITQRAFTPGSEQLFEHTIGGRFIPTFPFCQITDRNP